MATAVQTRVPPTTAPAPDSGPVPRRVRPPRWLDLRLVLGVLLVLGSVLLGARVVTSAATTVPVWAATGDLAAGTVLTADDLVVVHVRLGDGSGAYLSASTRPAGRTLSRAVHRGELVPRSALDAAASLVRVALPVQAGYVPPDLRRGQRVDVYAVPSAGTAAAVAAGSGAGLQVTTVVQDATVEAVSGHTQGVLSTPTTTVQVVVAVGADRAPAVLAAIGGRPLAVVVHGSVDDGGSNGAGAGGAAGGAGGAGEGPTG